MLEMRRLHANILPHRSGDRSGYYDALDGALAFRLSLPLTI